MPRPLLKAAAAALAFAAVLLAWLNLTTPTWQPPPIAPAVEHAVHATR